MPPVERAGAVPAGGGWTQVPVADGVLEVDVRGAGEPVVLIQTALTADELVPLSRDPVLAGAHRVLLYHRRGYAGSSRARGPGSIVRDAQDCAALMDVLGIARPHVVGLSYSSAVALQLAATAPTRVHSLCVIEPPPLHVASAAEFRTANAQLAMAYQQEGADEALDQFLTRVVGPRWRRDMDRMLPGSVSQVERDAGTFFGSDIPALFRWQFSAEDAQRITAPALYVGGTDSGPWFAQVHQLIRAWLPHSEDVILPGADHNLALTHTPRLAAALTAFLARHPGAR